MRPVAGGRPGTEVIPTGWAEAHQPVVEKTLVDAVVSLADPTATAMEFNESTRQNELTSAPAYYTGGARIQILDQQGQQVGVPSGDPEDQSDYLVVVAASVGAVREGHRVTVDSCDDEALEGLQLRVDTVARGSHRWERDLFCSLTG